MTDDKIALRSLLEEGSDTTFLSEMIRVAAERLMALETDTLCGTTASERSADRTNQRKGYHDRCWQTRTGTVERRIPKLRRGSYFPAFLEPRRIARHGLEISRPIRLEWRRLLVIGGAARTADRSVMAGKRVFAGDTPLPVLDPDRGPEKTGRLWAYARDDRSHGSNIQAAVVFSLWA